MLGYRIYFDGAKFVMEEKKTEAKDTPSDGLVHWNAEYNTALVAVENLNHHYKKTLDDLEDDDDFIIKRCKECREPYIITKTYADWFLERKLKAPSRCNLCRMRRKFKKKEGE